MKPVTYKGVTYESITACATHFGLEPSTVNDRLKKGLPLEPRNLHQWRKEQREKEAQAKAS